MPRTNAWHSGVPPDPHSSQVIVDEVLRAGLRSAFPLPEPDQGEGLHFRFLLDALTYVSQGRPQALPPPESASRLHDAGTASCGGSDKAAHPPKRRSRP